MKGFRGWGLGISKITALLLVLFVFLFPYPYTLYPTLATDSTPSADIRAKLEELKKEIASRAAKLKQEISNKLRDKAYVGKVKTKSPSSLTLATGSGPKIVSLNQDTEFKSLVKLKQKFSLSTTSEEDYLAGLGDVDETGVLIAKKIILLPTPNSELKTFLWGQIIAVSDKLVTLKDKNSKSIAISLPKLSTVKTLDFVILTGQMGKNEIFNSEFVYVIPQGGILKSKKVATPSAQPASSSAKTASPSGHLSSPKVEDNSGQITSKSSPKPTSR